MEGELRDQQLVVALRSIGRRRRTGILTVQGRDEIIAFSFANGSIVGADALNQSLEEGLGEVLASQQLVEPSDFAVLAAEHESGGGRVVDLLIERSVLSREQLLEGLRMHTYRLCLEALAWKAGEYRFYEGDEVAFEAGIEPVGVGELLVRATLDLGDAGPLPLPIPELDETYRRTSTAAGIGDEAGSATVAHKALELLNGRRALGEVAASADVSSFDIRDLASEWLGAGIIERVGEPKVKVEQAAVAIEPPVPTPLPEVELGSAPSLAADFDLDDRVAEFGEAEPVQVERSEKTEVVVRPQLFDGVALWLHRGYGLGIIVACLAVLVVDPVRILIPYPWQGAVEDGLRARQKTVQRLNVERAADTFFLLSGRYPENVSELEAMGLVGAGDLELYGGGRWRITATPASFILRTPEVADTPQSAWTSTIAGDFLLDPEFVRPSRTTGGPLLVLLD